LDPEHTLLRAIFRHLRGTLVLAGITINTLFWFIPVLAFAVLKLLLPVPSIRAWITRILIVVGNGLLTLSIPPGNRIEPPHGGVRLFSGQPVPWDVHTIGEYTDHSYSSFKTKVFWRW